MAERFPAILKALERSEGFPAANGQVGWVAHRDEIVALLSECTPRMSFSVIPVHEADGDATTFRITTSVMFSRSEMAGA